MYITIMIMILFVTSGEKAYSGGRITKIKRAAECPEFNCASKDEEGKPANPECIPYRWLCDADQDCSNKADEVDCICRPDQFQCGSDRGGDARSSDDVYQCIDRLLLLNGVSDCRNGKDTFAFRNGDPEYPNEDECHFASEQCDGFIDCPDASDEMNCFFCPDRYPHRCSCNQFDAFTCKEGYTCYNGFRICDGNIDCSDGSDEEDCSCKKYQFTCNCYETDLKSCSGRGCISMRDHCNGQNDCSDHSDEEGCLCMSDEFNCNCYETDPKSCSRRGCISVSQTCDGYIDCSDGSDEEGCSCREELFTCNCYETDLKLCSGRGCISVSQTCDGYIDCSDGSDEEGCSCREELFTCNCYETDLKLCSGRGCISVSQTCDGYIDCSDGSDEEGCSCREDQFTCNCLKTDSNTCSGRGCISMSEKCDGNIDCSDGSDEEGCTCREDQFTCSCYKTDPNSCSGRGCISMNDFLNGKVDCSDKSDEPIWYLARKRSGDCMVTIRRLNSVVQCDIYNDCDRSTCVITPSLNCRDITKCNSSQAICTSCCKEANSSNSCHPLFQCENGELEIAHHFCDGKQDCFDRSDEIGGQPGFKCSSSFGRCVVPQKNLYDDVAQCSDESDLCLHIPCFECLDRRLIISQNQLCDGIIDCFDFSDECLCDVHLRKPICEEKFELNDSSQLLCVNHQCHDITSSSIEKAQCQSRFGSNETNLTQRFSSIPSLIRCENKSGEIKAVTCDGRPECRDFKDECSCKNPPSFCSDSCHNFYPLGDRYCDGKIDEAWKFLNDSSCPEGFDEKYCPQRFICKAGNLLSIDRVQVCDGTVDCDDGSDEVDCTKESSEAVFSSQTEMIANIALRIVFWFMSLLVIIGNSFVLFSTAYLLSKEKMNESQKLNHILLVNLSSSDFLMGIYLFTISVKSVQYSGFYGDVDSQWRSSLECSIIGSFAIISSETSCFIMTILTAFRLYNVFNPFSARIASTLKWKLGIVLAWSVSLVLALLPVFKVTSNYFVYEIWFSNKFSIRKFWNKTDVIMFVCRLASLSNRSIELDGDAWESTSKYLHKHSPEYLPLGEFGYYGQTSICMPRIYTSRGDQAWVYSLVIITFNLVSFFFVAISYLLIYCKAYNPNIRSNRSDEQATKMQKRIGKLIATDFACWIPICVMAYLKTGGVEISDVVYVVTAGLLLPINSALNPLLYSPLAKEYFDKLWFKKKINSP